MKKSLLTLLTALALVLSGASAAADFTLPGGTTAIGDEAFMNARVAYYLTIPEGVTSIGARAFLGSNTQQVKLPASLTAIGDEAFNETASFEVVPGSYAAQWCRDHGYFCENMRVFVDKVSVNVYPGKPASVKAKCSYPGRVSAYRWEVSNNRYEWSVVEGVDSDIVDVSYLENRSESYLRCSANVNGVWLDAGNYATVHYYPGEIKFTENTRALSGDAVYLEWTYMGDDMVYFVHRCDPGLDTDVDGNWKKLAADLSTNCYTVYGLEKDKEYHFAVVAIQKQDDGRQLRYQTEYLKVKTLNTDSSFQFESCTTSGDSFSASWVAVDRAVYDIEFFEAGQAPDHFSWSENNFYSYALKKDTNYTIRVIAKVKDPDVEGGYRVICSGQASAKTDNFAQTITMLEVVPRGETVHLSWTPLNGCTYNVFLSYDGGETEECIAAELKDSSLDVGGLTPGETCYFCAQAEIGSWTTNTLWEEVTLEAKKPTGDVEYRALLIGEVSFKGTQYAARNYGDVEMIAEALDNTKTPNGSYYSVLRRKDLNTDAILSDIRTAFRDADDNDVSLFFIGTHGDINDLGRDAGCLSTVDSSGKEGYLDLYVLADELSKVKGKVIVLLGSCGSGAAIYEEGVPQNGDAAAVNAAAVDAFSRYDTVIIPDSAELFGDADTFDTGEFRQEGKFYVLTAARYHQMSWGTGADTFNYFGKFFTDGLVLANGRMQADADGNGTVTLDEMFRYIKSREEDKTAFIYQNIQVYPLNSEFPLFKQ